VTRMTHWLGRLILVALLVAPAASRARAPASVMATCKDGTSFAGTSRHGACRGHGGVQSWTTPAAGAAAPAVPPAASAKHAGASTAAMPTTPPGAGKAGAGQVWVNTASKVYHCPGDHYYGKTKHGEYLSEAAARAQGDRPSHGKSCAPD
jgi:hypothetical protein